MAAHVDRILLVVDVFLFVAWGVVLFGMITLVSHARSYYSQFLKDRPITDKPKLRVVAKPPEKPKERLDEAKTQEDSAPSSSEPVDVPKTLTTAAKTPTETAPQSPTASDEQKTQMSELKSKTQSPLQESASKTAVNTQEGPTP